MLVNTIRSNLRLPTIFLSTVSPMRTITAIRLVHSESCPWFKGLDFLDFRPIWRNPNEVSSPHYQESTMWAYRRRGREIARQGRPKLRYGDQSKPIRMPISVPLIPDYKDTTLNMYNSRPSPFSFNCFQFIIYIVPRTPGNSNCIIIHRIPLTREP